MAGTQRIRGWKASAGSGAGSGRTFREPKRYRVAIDRGAAAAMTAKQARGFTGAFHTSAGGPGAGSFRFDPGNGRPIAFADVTMAQARQLNRRGLLADSGADFASAAKHPRQARHAYTTPNVVIDLTDLDRLALSYEGISMRIKRGAQVISRAINHGLRRLRTETRRDLSRWTGYKNQGSINKAITLAWSTPTFLTGSMTVRSGHTVITKSGYGAAWNRRNPGATHSAWNRPQLAKGTFMIPGKKPVFKRTPGGGRMNIAPVWGPNLAREVERHEGAMQAKVAAIGIVVSREAARLMSVAIAQAR